MVLGAAERYPPGRFNSLCVFPVRYLGDPKRSWDTLSSDEMHSMFRRIRRVHGWDVFKRCHRTYRRLADAGFEPPATPEEKVSLIAAILSREAGVDLVPVFQPWRFPVTLASVKAMSVRYLARS